MQIDKSKMTATFDVEDIKRAVGIGKKRKFSKHPGYRAYIHDPAYNGTDIKKKAQLEIVWEAVGVASEMFVANLFDSKFDSNIYKYKGDDGFDVLFKEKSIEVKGVQTFDNPRAKNLILDSEHHFKTDLAVLVYIHFVYKDSEGHTLPFKDMTMTGQIKGWADKKLWTSNWRPAKKAEKTKAILPADQLYKPVALLQSLNLQSLDKYSLQAQPA